MNGRIAELECGPELLAALEDFRADVPAGSQRDVPRVVQFVVPAVVRAVVRRVSRLALRSAVRSVLPDVLLSVLQAVLRDVVRSVVPHGFRIAVLYVVRFDVPRDMTPGVPHWARGVPRERSYGGKSGFANCIGCRSP